MKTKKDDDFYAEYDEETGLYCVFGNNTGFAYASYADKGEAQEHANLKNERAKQKGKI